MSSSEPASDCFEDSCSGAAAPICGELEELKAEYHRLVAECAQKDQRIDQLAHTAVRQQLAVEMEEEGLMNRLLRKLDDARRSKQVAEQRLRQEQLETDRIMREVAELEAAQVEVENQIEMEQNFIMHRLQRELIAISDKKATLQRELNRERTEYLRLLRESLQAVAAAEESAAAKELQQASLSGSGARFLQHHPQSSGEGPTAIVDGVVTLPPFASGGGGGGNASSFCSTDTSASVLPLPHAHHHPHLLHGGSAPNGPTTEARILHLERELLALLEDHQDTERQLIDDRAMCDRLTGMLSRVHQEVTVDRDRLMSLQTDVVRAQSELAIAERGAFTRVSERSDDEGGVSVRSSVAATPHEPQPPSRYPDATADIIRPVAIHAQHSHSQPVPLSRDLSTSTSPVAPSAASVLRDHTEQMLSVSQS